MCPWYVQCCPATSGHWWEGNKLFPAAKSWRIWYSRSRCHPGLRNLYAEVCLSKWELKHHGKVLCTCCVVASWYLISVCVKHIWKKLWKPKLRVVSSRKQAYVTRSISCGAQLKDDTYKCLLFFVLTTDVTVCSCCSWCERREDNRGSSSKSRESCSCLHQEPQPGQSCCHPAWLAQVTETLLLGEVAENVMTQSETDANLEVKHEERL